MMSDKEYRLRKARELGIQVPALLTAALRATRQEPQTPDWDESIRDFNGALDELTSINREAVAFAIAYWSMQMVDQLCAGQDESAERVIQHFALSYLSSAMPIEEMLPDEDTGPSGRQE